MIDEIQSFDDLKAALADLVDPLQREMTAGIHAAQRMLKWSKRAAVRAFRAGRILDEGHQRVKASGRPLMDFYVWAEGLGYSSYQINTALNVFKCFKDESLVEGLTVEEAKEIAGLTTKKKRKPKNVDDNNPDPDPNPNARSGDDGKAKDRSGLGGGLDGSDTDEGNPEGAVIDAEQTTTLLYKLADLIEGVTAVRQDEDGAALIRIAEKVRELQLGVRVDGSANNQKEAAVDQEEVANYTEEVAR